MKVTDLKVLHVIDTLGIGGAEKMAILAVNRLNNEAVNTALLLLAGRGELFDDIHKNVKIFELKRNSLIAYRFLKKCSQIIKPYDIVHVHMRYNYKYIRLVQILFNIKTKIVLHDHYGSIDTDITVPIFFKVFKPKYYLGVSESLTSWAKNNLKIPPQKVFLLPNSISKEKVETNHVNKKGLVLVGNIKPIKNQLFAIRLAHELNEHITIYGKVQDQAYFEMLKNEIIRLNYKNRVHFKYGITNIQAELPKYKLGVHTAKSESGPLVLIEYLAQNLRFLSYGTGEVFKTIGEAYPKLFMNDFNMLSWKENALNIMETYNLNDIYNRYFSEKKYTENCINIYMNIMK